MSAQELIVVPQETALEVFKTQGGLDPYLAKIREEIDTFVPDTTTKKGRDAIAAIAYKVAKSKTYLDGVGKDLVAELKEIPKKIDEHRKTMRETLDAWKDEVRKPLTDWEAREQARIDEITAAIAGIQALTNELHILDAVTLSARIKGAEEIIIADHWQEFEAEVARAKDAALAVLRPALEARQKYDAEQVELARLRQQQAEREAKEAAEAAAKAQAEREEKIRQEAAAKALRDAGEKAEQERQAAIREANAAAEREANLRRQIEEETEKARQFQIEAHNREVQAKLDAERAGRETEARIKREQEEAKRKEEADLARREANKRHLKKINNEALAAFVAGGISEDIAKQAIILIAEKKIPHVQINY